MIHRDRLAPSFDVWQSESMPCPDCEKLRTLADTLVELSHDFRRHAKAIQPDRWLPIQGRLAREALRQSIDCAEQLDELLTASLEGEPLS